MGHHNSRQARATTKLGSPECARPKTGAIVLFMALLFLFPGPVILLFGARGFSSAISVAFPLFAAYRRPVNRLYFFLGAWPLERGP
jgi:hypothetical protein